VDRLLRRRNFGWWASPRFCPPCFTLLLPEVPRYRRVSIGLDAAKLLPAIDDDEVEVYGLAPAKINGYGAGAVRVHGIGGAQVNQRYDQPVKTLGPFTVAGPLAVTDDPSDGGVRPGERPRRDSAGKGGAKLALDAFERTVVRAGIGLLFKYITDPQQDEKTEHEAGFGWNAAVKHGWILLVSLLERPVSQTPFLASDRRISLLRCDGLRGPRIDGNHFHLSDQERTLSAQRRAQPRRV